MKDIISKTRDAIETLKSGNATEDQFFGAQEFLSGLNTVVSELKANLEAASLAWLQKHGGSIDDGVRRYYIGHPKTTKCRNMRLAMEGLMQAAGGDWDAVVDCLSSGAIKYGAAKKLLGEVVWAQHFEVTEKDKLETGEPATPRVQKLDRRFLESHS